MAEALHPAAPHHLPAFITAPGETDVLFVVGIVVLLFVVVLLGGLYFKLHALPERMAHGASMIQYQLVAVLALIALFTHNNGFWIAALLIALVPVPDFFTPLSNMSESLARMAGRRPRAALAGPADAAAPPPIDVVEPLRSETVSAGDGEATTHAGITQDAVPPAMAPAEIDARPDRKSNGPHRRRPAKGDAA